MKTLFAVLLAASLVLNGVLLYALYGRGHRGGGGARRAGRTHVRAGAHARAESSGDDTAEDDDTPAASGSGGTTPATSDSGTAAAADTVNHLLLQVMCGKGDDAACAEVEGRDQAGCAGGDGESCVLLGIAKQVGKQVPKDEAGAVPLFEKACDLSDGSGCWYAGSAYEQGRGVPKDADKAVALDRRACALDQENGCLDLGELLERAHDRAGALDAYDHGCRLKYDWACDHAKTLRGSTATTP